MISVGQDRNAQEARLRLKNAEGNVMVLYLRRRELRALAIGVLGLAEADQLDPIALRRTTSGSISPE